MPSVVIDAVVQESMGRVTVPAPLLNFRGVALDPMNIPARKASSEAKLAAAARTPPARICAPPIFEFV